jgi:hypothetical protein
LGVTYENVDLIAPFGDGMAGHSVCVVPSEIDVITEIIF